MSREIIFLNGSDWKFKKFNEGQGIKEGAFHSNYDFSNWKPASVPGDIHLDLLSNNEIEDPFYYKNIKNLEWIEEFEWWYQKEFKIDSDLLELQNKTIRLIFEGVDYLADFWLNGESLGSHEGMFGKIIYNISNIKNGINSLTIRLAPLKNFKSRFEVLKCQMSFGWDIAPKLKTSGIWDDVYFIISNKIYFSSCYITSDLKKDQAFIHFILDITNDLQKEYIKLKITIEGKNFQCEPTFYESDIELNEGLNKIEQVITLKNPELWNTWDKDEPNLYQAKIELIKNGETLDDISETFGIRKIEFLPNSNNPKHFPWIFQINGKKEYIRGTNWIPPDSLFGRIDKDRYERNLKLVKEANINLIRIWGGGIREKKAFYELCDELGIFIWQEFPIACVQTVGINFLAGLPTDKKYLKLFQTEAESIVRELRNHPSLILWCGGNEFHAEDNKKVVKLLELICYELDPSRIFMKTSPSGGDFHNYDIWHGMAPYSRYLKDTSPFCSEFGMSSYPNLSSLKKFLPIKELQPFGSGMGIHAPYMVKTNAHFLRIKRYIMPLKPNDSLEKCVQASQIAQGLAYKTAIEHYRRMKWANAGVGFWQFDDCWPGVCFSIIDYYFEPKLSYQYVTQAYQPLLISLEYDLTENYNKKDRKGKFKSKFESQIYIINDFSINFENLDLNIEIINNNEIISNQIFKIEKIEEESCEKFDTFKFEFPSHLIKAPKIVIKLISEGQIISKNEYDLSYYDPMQPTVLAKVNSDMARIVFEGKRSKPIRYIQILFGSIIVFILMLIMFSWVTIRWKKRKKL